MKGTIFILLFLCFQLSARSQELDFEIHHKKLNGYLNSERKLGSKEIPNKSTYVSGNQVAQPVSFLRSQKGIPDLITQYFYYKKDSTIAYILHEWDVNNFEKEANKKQSLKLQKALIKKYAELEKQINARFGEGKVEGGLSDLSLIDERGGLKKEILWKPDDSTEIQLYITISNFYEQTGSITIPPVHRIRLYIRNTSEKAKGTPKLNDAKVSQLSQISHSFFKSMGTKNIAESKSYLSPIIVNQVSEEQMKLLMDRIDANRKVNLFKTSIQAGLDGTYFTVLQFKYADDHANPPVELINIIFDNNDKIVGVRPIKLQ